MKNTLQTSHKAYPGTKHLAIARGLGSQGIVGSICPAQLMDASALDYGYRPAMRSILEAVRPALHDKCLGHALAPDAQGNVQCILLEGRATSGACSCDPALARSPVAPAHQAALQAFKQEPSSTTLDCFCEIDQVQGAALQDCQTNAVTQSNGWCYVDAAMGAAEAAVVANCRPGDKHEIRFTGNAAPLPGATVFIDCAAP